jgi:hypothetical protein
MRGRVRGASRLALSGTAAVLTIGAVGILGSAPAQAMNNQGRLIGVFVVQPTTTQVGSAVTPAVVVKVEYSDGQVDKDYNGPVQLEYAVNRLGAPLPSGNEVNAYCGIATFSSLTFSAVGFGFELKAVIPGQSQGSGSSQPGWSGMPGMGGMSQPSSPFDIVDQLLQCGNDGDGGDQPSCTSETVSSNGTSGSASAPNQAGTLAATGGGFPRLSCTTAGGVVSFSSNLSKTITVTLSASLAGHRPLRSFNICWGSPTPFATKFGFPALFNPFNGEYEGLLPNCSAYRPAPCVLSRSGGWGWPVVITIQAPAGDPHITY